MIGADSLWLVAVGRTIVRLGHLPDGIPYASGNSHDWQNVPVLSELAFYSGYSVLQERWLLVLQVAAVLASFLVLARLLRREGATDVATALVLLVVAIGSSATFLVIRVQLFSFVLFPVLLTLLYREYRAPSRGIWLLPPLVALWSSLHGAVLAGLAVAGAYLLVDRLRRDASTAVGVLVLSGVALFVTPALWNTPSYYAGVLSNEAARRAFGLWAPLGLHPFDVVLTVAAVVLLVLTLRARPAAWELVALAGLALLTARSARGGTWLLMLAAVPAARGLALEARVRPRLAACGSSAERLRAGRSVRRPLADHRGGGRLVGGRLLACRATTRDPSRGAQLVIPVPPFVSHRSFVA